MTVLVLLALAFLLFLAVLAVVVVRFGSTRDAEGRPSAPGCFAGCAVALALSLLGLAGLAVFAGAAALISAPSEEFRADLRDAAQEVGAGLRELGQELRENARDAGRELRESAREARRPRESRDTSATPSAAPTVAPLETNRPWRARIVVSWPGDSDPSSELLEALTRAALETPIDAAVHPSIGEDGGARTRAELTATSRAADVKALEALLRVELARASAELDLEYLLESVVDDDLR